MEPLDYNQLLAQLLADPDAFQKEFGAAFAPIHDEGDALRQQMAMAQQRSQPLNRVHSTGQGGMFGALGDVLRGVGGNIRQGQLSERLAENQQRVGQEKSAQALGLERLRGIQKGAEHQRDLELAERRRRELGGSIVIGQDGRYYRVDPATGEAAPVETAEGQPVVKPRPAPRPPADPQAKAKSDDIHKWNQRVQGLGVAKGLGAFVEIDRIADKHGGVSRIPGVGYLEGLAPTEALPEDAQRFRQEASALISQYRNKMFGASLTTEEKADFAKIADLGGRATAAQVAHALDILRRGFYMDAEEALAGAPAYVKDAILPDLGIVGSPRQFSTPSPGASAGGMDPAKKARLEELRRKKAAGELK